MSAADGIRFTPWPHAELPAFSLPALEGAPLLFGRDPTPGLLAFDLAADGRAIHLYRRAEGGVRTETVPFRPFLLLGDGTLVDSTAGLVAREPLEGPGAFRWLAQYRSWADALGARDRCREVSGQTANTPVAPFHFLADPVHQYLLTTGRTSFGGLAFGDLRRLALDIEVVTTDGYEFPSATRAGDRIVAVALADSSGFRHVVRGDRLDECLLLEECTRIVRERDPDVIEGHNIFRFDLEYLEARARRHGVALAWGRDGSALRGAAAKIDALMLREYLHRRHAVPAPQPPAPVGGGHTVICQQGVARPVLHVDVTSLYPSLMLAHSIGPASDALGVFQALLEHLRDFRVRAKRIAREAPDAAERAHLGALQQSFKILINAFYGYLAFSGGHWNDYAAADRVTAEGRAIVAALLERLTKLGATPVEADTDGVYFVPPAGHGPEDDDTLLEQVAAGLPPGIQLELDGRYVAMLSYKMKTYALLDERGRFVLKGSAFRSRGIEPFQRQLIEEVVRALLDGRREEVGRTINRRLDDFAAHRIDVRAFARTETLHESLDAYRQKITAGARPVSAAYELAAAAGRVLEPGDQISYYVTGRGVGVPVNERAKLASQWDPARPDENVEYYQAKVREIGERFRPFVEFDGLRPYDEEPEPQPHLSRL